MGNSSGRPLQKYHPAFPATETENGAENVNWRTSHPIDRLTQSLRRQSNGRMSKSRPHVGGILIMKQAAS